MITVYGKHGCGYCVKSKNLLESKKIPFTYLNVGEDIGINEFREHYPDIKSVPFILNDDIVIGGFEHLQVYLEEVSGKNDDF
jgi:glutaredoxin 1